MIQLYLIMQLNCSQTIVCPVCFPYMYMYMYMVIHKWVSILLTLECLMMVIPILRKSNWKNPADMTTITVFLNIPYGLKSIPHDFSQNCSVTMWVVCSLSNSLVVEKISHKDWTWDLSISPPDVRHWAMETPMVGQGYRSSCRDVHSGYCWDLQIPKICFNTANACAPMRYIYIA